MCIQITTSAFTLYYGEFDISSISSEKCVYLNKYNQVLALLPIWYCLNLL